MAEFQKKLISHIRNFLFKMAKFFVFVRQSLFLLSVKLLEIVILSLEILSK